MPSQPKGARWGMKAMFGNKHGQKGCKIFLIGPGLLTVGAAGALAAWRVAESSGVL